MLHLIPPPLHRQLYRIADRVRRLWWRIRRPRRQSVHVLAFDERGRLLLVRHSYGQPVWTVPGGGLGRGEDPETAAAREVREELGCGLTDLALLDVIEELESGSIDRSFAFTARLVGEPVPDMREIVEVALVDPANLPQSCGRRARRRIARALARGRDGASSEQR